MVDREGTVGCRFVVKSYVNEEQLSSLQEMSGVIRCVDKTKCETEERVSRPPSSMTEDGGQTTVTVLCVLLNPSHSCTLWHTFCPPHLVPTFWESSGVISLQNNVCSLLISKSKKGSMFLRWGFLFASQ